MFSVEGITPVQLLGWLVPGVMITFVRSRFLTGRADGDPTVRGALGSSLVYATIAFPFLGQPDLKGEEDAAHFYWVVVLLPVLVGLVLGVLSQGEPMRPLFERLGLRLVHDIPSAWDYVFARRKLGWMIVTLNDGTKYLGCYVRGSFASSDPAERDLFLSHLAVLDEDGETWIDRPGRSILIGKGAIVSIELCDSQETARG